jgi:hypothetical protein
MRGYSCSHESHVVRGLELIRQGVRDYSSGFCAGAAVGIRNRRGHRNQCRSNGYQAEIAFQGLKSSPRCISCFAVLRWLSQCNGAESSRLVKLCNKFVKEVNQLKRGLFDKTLELDCFKQFRLSNLFRPWLSYAQCKYGLRNLY